MMGNIVLIHQSKDRISAIQNRIFIHAHLVAVHSSQMTARAKPARQKIE
jgi:hypothetical protein